MPDSERVYKVALFGITGCGKSSIINLLSDKPAANVSTGVEACTKRAQWYPISLGGKKFRLWDTMGFNQAEAADINPLSPYEQAHTLLRNLQEGVDLILLCARKDGVNAWLRSIYWLLDDFFFAHQAQIALVLTHFDTPDEDWWERNWSVIAQRCNIPVESIPHACITTVRSGSDSTYDQSKLAMQELLQNHATNIPTPVPLRVDLLSDNNEGAAMALQRLCSNCPLSSLEATALVERFKSPKRTFHAILFGDVGVGKSSVINLAVGQEVAPTSEGIDSCTLDSRSYKVNAGLNQFLIWDTVGFNGTYIGKDVCRRSIENAVRLVRDLHREGGVDLLIFCKSSGRLSSSERNNLILFQEFLCEGEVPVAFVITHLEKQEPMEKWWTLHGEGLIKACNLKPSAVAGHACITSLPDDPGDQKLHEKLAQSRQSIQCLLEDSTSYGSTFDRDERIWIMSFLRKLVGMMKAGSPQKKEKITAKVLKERCGLYKEDAEELIKLFHAQD